MSDQLSEQKLNSAAVISPCALARLRGIHQLSREYNGRLPDGHRARLLDLMKKHVVEIEDLIRRGDPHYLTETGDLAILCFEILLEENVPVDETLTRCFTRYERKLQSLIAHRPDPS